jgi:type I restriction enzyme S subunit
MKCWKTSALGEVVSIVGGGTPTRSNPDFYGGSIPWVTPKDMKSWEITGAQIALTQAGVDNSSTRVVPPNSILIVVRSGVLKHTVPVGLNRVPVAINQDMKALQCHDQVDADFLARFIKAQSHVILKWVRATTADNFPIDKLKKLPVPLPPLAEQRRIAEVLDKAEALRAKRRAALAQLDSLTQSLFLDLFGDPIPNERDWPVSPIGELDIQIADGNYSSKYPTSSEFVESGVPFIRANNLRDMTVVADDMRFISPAKHHELQKGHLAEGDVLITTRGDIGNIAVVPRTFHDANINAQIVLLRPNPTHLDSRYLAYLLDLPQMKIRIQSFQNGVALKQLPIRQLVRISVPVPPIPLQREFARRVTAVEALKTAQRASLAELDALFATLQHRAFKGEL